METKPKLNWEKLHADRKAIEAEIREQKGILRESFQPRLNHGRYDAATKTYEPSTFERLRRAKKRVSELYQLIAYARGRIHFKNQKQEEQAEAVQEALKRYVLASEGQAA